MKEEENMIKSFVFDKIPREFLLNLYLITWFSRDCLEKCMCYASSN